MSDPYEEPEPDGWPCVLSEEVTSLLMDLTLPADVFGAVVAATVLINETRGEVEFTELRTACIASELR